MEKITFCINTCNNEKSYVELLLQSLLNGIDVDLHDIFVFVDSDNQYTTDMLIAQKSIFPNLTIIKNTGEPIGYASNINYMFSKAKTNIVSYLQSDMVVGLEYDVKLLSHLKENMILSSTRIEPPLHTKYSNQITFVQDFGLSPEEFKYNKFISFSEENKDNSKLTNYFFAPFTLYKHLWNDIGGHDVGFKKSREDSDIALRFCLNKYNLVQCWDAMVYHFTCTSSRGIDWWKQEHRDKETTRQQNDAIELDRFIKKWNAFLHPKSYQEIIPYLNQYPDMINKIQVKNPPINDLMFDIF